VLVNVPPVVLMPSEKGLDPFIVYAANPLFRGPCLYIEPPLLTDPPGLRVRLPALPSPVRALGDLSIPSIMPEAVVPAGVVSEGADVSLCVEEQLQPVMARYMRTSSNTITMASSYRSISTLSSSTIVVTVPVVLYSSSKNLLSVELETKI